MKVLGFGAVLWDEIKGQLNIGGAVFNVIAHSKKLGAETYFFTAIGNDDLGKKIFDIARSKGIHTDMIKKVDVPTCIVKVSIDRNAIPSYTIDDFTSWDLINVNLSDISLINKIKFDYFCFGTIEQRSSISLKSLRKILEECNFRHVFLDMNLRLHYYDKEKLEYSMEKSDILKMNGEETEIVRKIFGFKEKNYEELTNRIREKFNIQIVCITKGEMGAYISSEEKFDFCPSYKVKVVDTNGAGDAFSAALMNKLYSGSSQKAACDFACKFGALIASRRGAIPNYSITELDKIYVS